MRNALFSVLATSMQALATAVFLLIWLTLWPAWWLRGRRRVM